jgi:two-component system CheB/CheR fusion protein
VVAMGASAGGLEAYERFFSRMPPDSGMAFVLVPHLDAHHRSAMVELLQRYTRMEVVEIGDRMEAAPNRVHVIPPNATLTFRGGVLRIATPRGPGMTIDTFLRSLAEERGEEAVGIVLSGSGSDGTVGLKAIKEHGGLTIAQVGEPARHDSMPRSAIASGMVDVVLPVEDMPARLVQHAQHLARLATEYRDHELRRDGRKHLATILALLRSRTGHDFSQYKESTFVRRIRRRMQIVHLTSVDAYVELLRKEPREVDALFRDLLIGVTSFFRDAKAFEALNDQIIAPLLADKGPQDQVRVWVPGCATGEEAYSIAILLRERMTERDLPLKVQIFATDLDEEALNVGRHGVYPASIAQDISPERLERFFVPEGSTYRVVKEIREMCIFSVHNLIKDAPFSKLDLISCRNLLIYFDASLQSRVLSVFHFALRQRGYLFLGPSENATQQPRLFSRVNSKLRLFKARVLEAHRVVPELPLNARGFRNHPEPEHRPLPGAGGDSLSRRAYRLLEAYAPASVVVDENHEILHFFGRTARYFQPSPGVASLNLFNIVEASLRPDLRTAIHQALTSDRRVIRENLTLPVNGGFQSLNIIVEPLPGLDGGLRHLVVIFQEVGGLKPQVSGGSELDPELRKDETIQHLETELIATRERLQATIEELETSNEEMKSSNEEFQSVNEELQSSNEELETSKEELQSVNEELETVNAELHSKIESLDRANNDRKNLLESTQIATLFLDTKLRVKSFTPAIMQIFHLIDSDYGRPITDIATRIAYTNLQQDVRHVLRTLDRIEQEVALVDSSASYIMRILPYRTIDNLIDGAVITFVDITARKQSQEASARLAAIVSSSHDAIIGMTLDGTIESWNLGAERIYGYAAAEAVGHSLALVIAPDRPQELQELQEMLDRLHHPTTAGTVETERITKDNRRIHVSTTVSPVTSAGGKLIAVAAIERDITERKRAEEQQGMLLRELNHRVKNTLATVLSIAFRTRQTSNSLDSFGKSFEDRIRALAGAHDLLAQNVWSGVELRQLVLMSFAPYRGEKDAVLINGDDLFISAQAALVLGMVFHELATNAAKYGALSTPSGSVEVNWKVQNSRGSPLMRLDWSESGGPKVRAPAHQGFGLKFIERSLDYELRGSVALSFRPEGLRCRLQVPVAELTAKRKRDHASELPS